MDELLRRIIAHLLEELDWFPGTPARIDEWITQNAPAIRDRLDRDAPNWRRELFPEIRPEKIGSPTLKLYIWREVLTDYSDGIAFAIAESVNEARWLIVRQYREDTGVYNNYLLQDLEKEPSLICDGKYGLAIDGGA